MDERRLYAILGAGAAIVLFLALLDVGNGDDNDPPTTTSSTERTSTTTAPSTTTTLSEGLAADRIVQADLRTALTTMKVVYAEQRRYDPEPSRLRPVEPSLQYARGLATTAAAVGAVYVETDSAGQVACASARSSSGELFLVKHVAQGTAPGTWYARGAGLPTRCDGERLDDAW